MLFLNCNDEFKDGIRKDSVVFWVGVSKYENSAGARPFWALAFYALTCFATPLSNAPIEWTFSFVTIVKSKFRNCMSTSLLDAIIRIRCHLSFQGECLAKTLL